MDQIEALRYKLRMFGVRIERESNIYCDNQPVVKNTSLPESTLNMKHNAICYHRVREVAAAKAARVELAFQLIIGLLVILTLLVAVNLFVN